MNPAKQERVVGMVNGAEKRLRQMMRLVLGASGMALLASGKPKNCKDPEPNIPPQQPKEEKSEPKVASQFHFRN